MQTENRASGAILVGEIGDSNHRHSRFGSRLRPDLGRISILYLGLPGTEIVF
jgi:hypothetical protein